MKVVSLVAFLALAACKPDPATKPAPAATPSAGQPAPARTKESPPGLPDEAGSDAPADIEHRSRLDKDGDGVVSPEERAAAKAERAKRMHDRYDTNHDGKLTPDELAAAGSGHRGPRFDDPAALDTDHNGEISADELQQGMRDWRIEHRHQATGGGSGSAE
jgi:hypothetical protein